MFWWVHVVNLQVSITTLHIINMWWPLRPLLAKELQFQCLRNIVQVQSHYKYMSQQHLSCLSRHLSCGTRKSANLPQQYICIVLSLLHDEILCRTHVSSEWDTHILHFLKIAWGLGRATTGFQSHDLEMIDDLLCMTRAPNNSGIKMACQLSSKSRDNRWLIKAMKSNFYPKYMNSHHHKFSSVKLSCSLYV